MLCCVCNSSRLSYSCPKEVPRSYNDNHNNFQDYNENRKDLDRVRFRTNRAFLEYDGWGITHSQRMEILQELKRDWFCPEVPDHGRVYESACGQGYNLLHTGEVLAECGRRGVTLYGSDYLAGSVEAARSVVGRMGASDRARGEPAAAPTPAPQVGVFCRADSTSLGFVPAASFDLVFTGYIDPILDPLNLGWDRYSDVCNSSTAAGLLLQRTAQSLQERWFSRWVREMLRLVRPGGVVVVESVAPPHCLAQEDWGGVDEAWWVQAAADWDVEPGSVEVRRIVNNVHTRRSNTSQRYHVRMRRR